MRWPWQRKKDPKPAPEQVVETPAAEEADDTAALVRASVPDDEPEATPEPAPEPEPEPKPAPEPDPEPEPERKSWLARLTGGLAKSSARLTGGIVGSFNRRKLDDDALEELEEALIMADLGAAPAAKIVADFAKTRFDKEVTDEEIREALAEQLKQEVRRLRAGGAVTCGGRWEHVQGPFKGQGGSFELEGGSVGASDGAGAVFVRWRLYLGQRFNS